MSASNIARVMGGGLSRNAVIGKATRLNLTRRASSYNTVRDRGYIPVMSAQYKPKYTPKEKPLPVEESGAALVLDDGSHVTLETMAAQMCHWPVGDPSDPSFHFCGLALHKGPYCEGHARKAYQPHKPRAKVHPPREDARGRVHW